jgi:LacI family transcriptional regulator
VRTRRADGIILIGPRLGDGELDRIQEEGIPIVLIGQMHGSNIPFVDIDNIKAAQASVSHLTSLGHQRIACITNAPKGNTASEDRLEGYRSALGLAGLPFDPGLVRWGNFTDESGYLAMKDILATCHPLPSAVFVASDLVALGVLRALSEAGFSVPEDFALVSFDDIPLARYIQPSLTTMRLPAYDLGFRAGQMMVRLLHGAADNNNFQCLLNTELILRRSCGSKT